MKTWITLGIFIIWCEEMGFVVGMKKDPRAPPSRNQRSNPGQNMPPPRQDNPFRLPLPTIYKKTCAPTKYSYDYSSPPLVMDCARFNTVYQIVVEQIDFVKGGNCASLADSFCFSGVDWDYKAKTGILEANGHGYWEISNVSPVFSTKCLSTSTHVFVTYSCRDTSARREMCEDVYFSTSGVVDLTTPSYPFDFPESPYIVACRCKASTGENGGIRLTLLDLNFTNPNGGCEGHYFSNGSVVDWNRLSGGYGGDQNYACYPNIPTPLNITYYKRSVSFVYMSYVDDGTAIYKRGAWFQLKGVRLTGDPDVQNVRLTIQCETVMDTSSGSGWLEETWETTQIPSPTRRSATRFTKLSYRPSTSTPYPTNTHQKTSSTPVTPPNQEGTIKPAGHKDNFIGVAVGVAVGGLVALALFAVAVFLCLRRRSLDETSDMETKGTISPSGPTLPPRNPGMKRSVKSGGHTVPEYFEPLDDSLYCIPEEVAKDTAPYAVLEGADNPQYLVPVINRSPNNPQQTPIATCQPTYEDGHPAVDDDSFSDYDNAETMPDYENTREALETKSSGEYYNLPDQAKSSDMESVSMGRPLENKNSGGYCNVVDHVPSPELNSNTKTPLENKNSGGYCGLVDPGVSNATDSVYQPLGS